MKLKVTMLMSLHKKLQYEERDYESEYSIRTRSVASNLLTSLKIIQSAVLLCCVTLDKHGTVPWPLNLFFVVALKLSVLQATT